MKLSPIEVEHILQAAESMEKETDGSWAEYWIQFKDGREYQFKHLVRKAFELATGQTVKANFFQSNKSYRAFINKFLG